MLIVNWNGREDLVACLQSLTALEYPSFHIIVVDNGSQDGSVGVIRERFPAVQVIENQNNTGFAEGNNIGIRAALDTTDYVLLLNNDTLVDARFLRELVTVADADPRIAVAGPVIYYEDARETIWCAGLQLAHGSAFRIPIAQTSSVLMLCGRPATDVPPAPYDVDAVVGCAMLLRTCVLREIGLLDASLFMIHEDFDWCLRAHAAGYRCVVAPVAPVWHRVSSSIQRQDRGRRGNPVAIYYWYRNWLLVVRKHFGGKAAFRVMFLYACRLFPALLFRAVREGTFSMTVVAAYGYALLDGLRRRTTRRFVK